MSSMTYKGFDAKIEFDEDDQIFVGRIVGIADVVGFHSDNVAGLEAAFHETVNDYVVATTKFKSVPCRSLDAAQRNRGITVTPRSAIPLRFIAATGA